MTGESFLSAFLSLPISDKKNTMISYHYRNKNGHFRSYIPYSISDKFVN